MSKITIKALDVSIGAEFLQTATAHAIYNSLPLNGSVNVWGDVPRAYSPVNVFGRVKGDALVFKTVANGSRILIEAA